MNFTSRRVRAGEAIWVIPFACIALLGCSLFRALPVIPPPRHYKTYTAPDGSSVKIALPFRGIACNWVLSWYLADTHAPDLLIYGDGAERYWRSDNVMSWIFPNLGKPDQQWHPWLAKGPSGANVEAESVLAFDAGVYLGGDELLHRIGLPILSPYSDDPYVTLQFLSSFAGHPEIYQYRLDVLHRVTKELQRELGTVKLEDQPHVSMDTGFSPYAELGGMQLGTFGGDEDGLVDDPDVLLVNGLTQPASLYRDPRWQGLKFVRNRSVYLEPGMMSWFRTGTVFNPVEARWLAEMAHPDRLQPKVRSMLRDIILDEYHYRLSDDQMDDLLNIKANSESATNQRFTRGYVQSSVQVPAP